REAVPRCGEQRVLGRRLCDEALERGVLVLDLAEATVHLGEVVLELWPSIELVGAHPEQRGFRVVALLICRLTPSEELSSGLGCRPGGRLIGWLGIHVPDA